MLTTISQKTLAYVNLFAVLGALENLCELVPEAKDMIRKDSVAVGFSVKGGPAAVLAFGGGRCALSVGCENPDIKLPFGGAERFNALIDGKAVPIPSKGFTKLPFLLMKFDPLTKLLVKYLKPSPGDLKNPAFARINTLLTLYTASAAVSQVANHDRSGAFSAAQIPDGDIAVNIAGETGVTIQVRGHRLTTVKKPCEKPRAIMEFADLNAAGRLLRGEESGMAAICAGSVKMYGMVNMIDNINRILDRVSQYLG